MQTKGSGEVQGCPVDIKSSVTWDGKGADWALKTQCNSFSLESTLRHTVPRLKSAGLPDDNKLTVQADWKDGYRCSAQLTSGKCNVKVDGEIKTKAKKEAEWRLFSENNCPLLKDAGFPAQAITTGSVRREDACAGALTVSAFADGQRAALEARATCRPKLSLQARLQHDAAALRERGLPPDSRVALLAGGGDGGKYRAEVELSSGRCHLNATANIKAKDRLEWAFSGSNQCPAVKDLGVPGKVELKGSADRAGCPINLKSLLRYDERRVELGLDTACGSYSLLGKLKHNVPQLKSVGVPDDNKLSLQTDWKDGYRGSAELKSGKCNVKVAGELKPEKKSTWTLTADNKCPRLSVTWPRGSRDWGMPATMQTKGSAEVQGCPVDIKSSVTWDGKGADWALKTQCNSFSLESTLRHTVPQLKSAGLPDDNRLSLKLDWAKQYEASAKLLTGKCEVQLNGTARTGKKAQWDMAATNRCSKLQDWGVPAAMQAKGSAEMQGCPVDIKSSVTWDGKGTDWALKTQCNSFSLESTLHHTVPRLKSAGLPDDNKLSLRADWKDGYRGSAELKSGKCNVKVDGELKLEKKSTWTLTADNKCPRLSDLGVPAAMQAKGSAEVQGCPVDIKSSVTWDGKGADWALKTQCNSFSLESTLRHTVPRLKSAGLPDDNKLSLRADWKDVYRGSAELKSGKCNVKVDGELKPEKKSTWTLTADNKCPRLSDWGVPAAMQAKGSAEVQGCPVDIKSSVTWDGKGADWALKTQCNSFSLESTLRHTVPQLKSAGLPDDNKLSLQADWKNIYRGSAELKSGKCNVKVDGELKPEKKSTWTLTADNKCPRLSVTWAQGTRE
ncbi:unnamed protein product [Lampetra fluviatilis]